MQDFGSPESRVLSYTMMHATDIMKKRMSTNLTSLVLHTILPGLFF